MKPTDTSRRSVLALGSAGLAVAAATAASPRALRRALPKLGGGGPQGLTVLRSGDAGFAARLESLFPGLGRVPGFARTLPFAAILSNSTGRGIRGVSVLWQISASLGTYQAGLFHFSRPTRRFVCSGDRPWIRVGASQLVTPFASLSPSRYRYLQDRGGISFEPLLQRDEARRFFAFAAASRYRASFSIDAVIRGGGVLDGPDQRNFRKHYQIIRNAEHDEAVWALKAIHGGVGRRALAQALKGHRQPEAIAGHEVLHRRVFHHRYFITRSQYATAMSRWLKATKGKGEFAELLKRARRHKRTELHRGGPSGQ